MAKISKLLQISLIAIIRLYQYLVSPLIGPHCRFYPSCSCYALDALNQCHITKAFGLILVRILKCHPLHPGGYDPVPTRKQLKGNKVQ